MTHSYQRTRILFLVTWSEIVTIIMRTGRFFLTFSLALAVLTPMIRLLYREWHIVLPAQRQIVSTPRYNALGLCQFHSGLQAQRPIVSTSRHDALGLCQLHSGLQAQRPIVSTSRHDALGLCQLHSGLQAQRPIVSTSRHDALGLCQLHSGLQAQRPIVSTSRHDALGLCQLHSSIPAPRCMFLCATFHTQRDIDRPRLSWTPHCSFGSVNDSETFLCRAAQTTYGRVLEKNMTFDIGVYRWGFNGTFHDCIVVWNAMHGCVTLELCRDPETTSRRIVPMCQHFQGHVKNVKWKKRMKCTFKDLAKIAMDAWRKMGSYDCIENNCQTFCNLFLEYTDAPQYMTTVENAALGSSGVLATFALLFMSRK